MSQDFIAEALKTIQVPFSDQELLAAYRLSMSEAEAREAVRGFREMQAWAEQNIRDFSADPEAYARRLPEGLMPAFGVALAWDTLVILSLLGDVELARRADEYRRSLEGDEAEGERRWRDRQERLRPWVIEQLRKLGR